MHLWPKTESATVAGKNSLRLNTSESRQGERGGGEAKSMEILQVLEM